MTRAGYIHDQRCPTDPSHGNALVMEYGYWCPHDGHTPGKGEHLQAFWHFDEWERLKRAELESPTYQPPTKPKAIRTPKNG